MKRGHPLSAAQTALLVGAGGVFMFLGFLVPGLFYSDFHHASAIVRAFLIVPLFVLGTTLMLLYSNRLKRGIRDARWPEEEVEALQTTLHSRYWVLLIYLCLAAWVCSFFTTGKFQHLSGAAYSIYLALFSLRQAIQPPQADLNAPPKIAPSRPAPITSTRWGHP